MNNNSKRAREINKQAERELERRQREQQALVDAEQLKRDANQLNADIEMMENERKRLVAAAVELRKTDPEGATTLIAQGASLDAVIKNAKRAVIAAQFGTTRSKISELTRRSLELLEKINSSDVVFKSQKELAALRKKDAIHAIALEMQDRAYQEELAIFLGGNNTTGAGSAFEQDVLAAERLAEIDSIDD